MSVARDSQMDVCVVMAVAGAGTHLAEQLDALSRQRTGLRWELVIADNGMLPSALTAVASAPIASRVVDARAVRGPAYARNVGAEASQAPLVLFCDDDDIVDAGWLDALAKALQHADLVGGRLRTDRLNPGSLRVPPKQHDRLPTVHEYLPYVVSCSMGVRKDSFMAVAGFDPSMPTSEDVDLSWRMQMAGATAAFVPDAVVDYRIREAPEAFVSQQVAYGRSSGLLRVKYRDVVAPLRISDEVRLAARLAVGLRHVWRRGPRRTGWWGVVRYWWAERRVLLASKVRLSSNKPKPLSPRP